MPPRHCDSPLRHRAFRVAFGHRGENASRLFIEKRMKQRYSTSEVSLDARCARYREGDFPDAAQIARFRNRRGIEMSHRENRSQYDEKRYAPAVRAEHF